MVGNYIDRALSAKTDDRPEFQRMVKDSARRLFDVVIVWKLDRFARNRYDSAYCKMQLKKNGARVVSAKENISDRPEGILLESMLEGYAEFYSAELSEKVLRGFKENALKALYNGGGMPLGYCADAEKHFQIVEHEAVIVREVFTRFAGGETIAHIISDLNDRGLRTKSGKLFRPNSLHMMLHNRKYIGEYRYLDVVIPNGVPRIVSDELFDSVQERLAKCKRAPAREKAVEKYLLTTKLFCGKCGAYMTGESGRSKTGAVHHYYKCAKAKRGSGCKLKAVKKTGSRILSSTTRCGTFWPTRRFRR